MRRPELLLVGVPPIQRLPHASRNGKNLLLSQFSHGQCWLRPKGERVLDLSVTSPAPILPSFKATLVPPIDLSICNKAADCLKAPKGVRENWIDRVQVPRVRDLVSF